MIDRRRRAPRGEGERLREEILAATERLLISTGDAEAVSIRSVAEAVGVTPPSIYMHFSDKAELIFAVCERNFAAFDAILEEAGNSTGDPRESLRRRGLAYVRFGIEHPEQYRILFMSSTAALPKDWTPERLVGTLVFDHHVAAVQRCIDAGEIAAGDPVLIATGLWAVVHGITSLLVAKRTVGWPVDELVGHLLSVTMRGLAPAEAAVHGAG